LSVVVQTDTDGQTHGQKGLNAVLCSVASLALRVA